ncbi:MAG: hypothetical protein LQ340_000846 [Diploschistes diacapsis]|nr:MAG: hypothetical protein LQ340_000846 [Diploschistes diacapsis]
MTADNNPGCSINGPINYDAWMTSLASTPSVNAKLFLGVPAAHDGAPGTPSGAQYYLAPSDLASLASRYESDVQFGSVTLWSAGLSASSVNNRGVRMRRRRRGFRRLGHRARKE